MRLRDKTCVITGAAQGIGLATARRFAEEGALVIVCDVDAIGVARSVAEIGELGRQAWGQVTDVTSRDSVEATVAAALDRFGRIDVLINNAGITRDARLANMTDVQWDAVIDVNLKGVFHMTQAVSRSMLERRAGSIVTSSSVSGVYGNFGQGTMPRARPR